MSYMPRAGNDARFVNVTGDSMTGDLSVDHAGASNINIRSPDSSAYANMIAPAGQTAGFVFATPTGQYRWAFIKGQSAESGGNNGSDFSFVRFDDAGNLVNEPIQVSRATGRVKLNHTPTDPPDGATKDYVDNAGPQGGGVGTFTSTTIANTTQTSLNMAQSYLNGLGFTATQLTTQKAGWWAFSFKTILSGSVGTGRAFAAIVPVGPADFRSTIGNGENYVHCTAMMRLAVNTNVAFQIYHTSGSSLTIPAGGNWYAKYLGNE